MTMDPGFLHFLTLTGVVLGGLGAILGGASMILHAIAPRTKTPVDDQLAADVDSLHGKVDDVLGLLRGVAPGGAAPSSSTSTVAPIVAPARNPQSGRVALGVVLVAALPALMAVGIAI